MVIQSTTGEPLVSTIPEEGSRANFETLCTQTSTDTAWLSNTANTGYQHSYGAHTSIN
jgi:hypothetical protein